MVDRLMAVACLACASLPGACAQADDIVLRTRSFRIVLTPQGAVRAVVDASSGRDVLHAPGAAPAALSPFVMLSARPSHPEPVQVSRSDDDLIFRFTEPDATVALRAVERPDALLLRVVSLTGASTGELVFGRIGLAGARHHPQSGLVATDRFAMCVRGDGPNVRLHIKAAGQYVEAAAAVDVAYAPGAAAIIMGAPRDAIRTIAKRATRNAAERWSPTGGPFALDAPETRGSYTFAFGVTEKNVDQWIALARKAGISTIHLCSWEQSLGSYHPSKEQFPTGVASLKRVVARIHAAGLKAGMHTLTGCIGPGDPLVTPVPDRRLAVDVTFTLASALAAGETAVTVSEKPQDLEKVWAYMGRGNVLRVGDELIQYTDYTQAPPYRFTGITRGAFGTKQASHAAGAKAEHLYVRYGCFSADPDNGLADHVAECIAAVANTCGFDMIYMDGAEGMPGGERGIGTMRAAIYRRLKRRTLVEGSEWGYASWWFHSRIGAYDYPNWGLKRFIDEHCRQNDDYRKLSFMPAQIGWWSVFGPNADRWAQTPDEIEYLCTKSLAFDMAMSFQGLGLGEPENGRQPEYLDTIGSYERLRLSNAVPESVRAILREPARDFRLRIDKRGGWAFVPEEYLKRRTETSGSTPVAWRAKSRFTAAPARIRIHALDTAEPNGSPTGTELVDLRTAAVACAVGGEGRAAVTPSAETAPDGSPAAALSVADQRVWASFAVDLTPSRDLRPFGAMGVWVKGDGKGEVLNFQLTNPSYHWGTCDEHYVTVDFTGWRYVELHLKERDAERFWDLRWPYGDLYSVNRNPLIRAEVSRLTVYVGGLGASGAANVLVSPVRALRLVEASIVNPALAVGADRVRFNVTLKAGEWLEYDAPGDCRHYDQRGKLLGSVPVEGNLPAAGGECGYTFRCENADGKPARAEVVIIVRGPEIGARRGPRR